MEIDEKEEEQKRREVSIIFRTINISLLHLVTQ